MAILYLYESLRHSLYDEIWIQYKLKYLQLYFEISHATVSKQMCKIKLQQFKNMILCKSVVVIHSFFLTRGVDNE